MSSHFEEIYFWTSKKIEEKFNHFFLNFAGGCELPVTLKTQKQYITRYGKNTFFHTRK